MLATQGIVLAGWAKFCAHGTEHKQFCGPDRFLALVLGARECASGQAGVHEGHGDIHVLGGEAARADAGNQDLAQDLLNDGHVLAQKGGRDEGAAIAELDLNEIAKAKKKFGRNTVPAWWLYSDLYKAR